MLHSSILTPSHWQTLITHPVLTRSMDWIKEQQNQFVEGIHELEEPGWFVNVHGYATLPPELCRWENHTRTIDIQYVIEGAETVRMLPSEVLGTPESYSPANDTELFHPPSDGTPFVTVNLQAGDFVMFFPGEAHLPKICLGDASQLRKLVVKIPSALLL